ncbi:MAG: glycosyltransferase family 1 protein [Actinomycetota bacterium]
MAASPSVTAIDQLRIAVGVEQLWHRVPGGTGRATVETVAALGEIDGVQLHGLAAWHPRRHRGRAAAVGPVTHVPLPRPVLYESWLRLRRPPVEWFVGEVDVAWASSMVVMPTTSAPLVATVHDLGFLDQPSHNSRRGRDFFPRAWAAVRRRADRIVCPSQAVADDCAARGVDPERLSVVPWGVRPPLTSSETAAELLAPRCLPERFALWVGTIEPRKNLARLVEAVRRIDGLHLVVVGPDGWNIDGTDLLAPLGHRVHRLGSVDDHELSALYRMASVFAFPSLLEGFGLPVLEAMMHGTPVVTSTGTATAEVADGAARLIDPLDAPALSRAIEAVWGEPERTSALVAAGRRRANELSWARTAAGYHTVFREVAR